MNQKICKKSVAFRMGIPRKGWRTSKSLSPDMIQEALEATANSRNLSSLGSRQSDIFSNISCGIKMLFTSFRKSSLFGREIYLSNLERTKVSNNSLKVSLLLAISPTSLLFRMLLTGQNVQIKKH